MIDLVGSIADAMTAQNAEGALKVEADLERYKRVFAATAPDLIVECGTAAGASALWFADTAGCRVVTVDVNPQVRWETWERWAGRVTPVVGSSADQAVIDEVVDLAFDYSRVMVVLDSDHSAKHVAAELVAYADLVTPGCYLVVEDTLARYMPWFGIDGSPLDAVEDWLPAHPEFTVDRALEDFSPRTQHPMGYLRRMTP